VGRAVRNGPDVWGNRLLEAPDGPTYASAKRFLAPLLYGMQRKRRPLTASGVYYLPLAYPTSENAPTAFALHVADGSEIITRRIGGPNVTIDVGTHGTERYGSCLSRTRTATLAEGYLPIMETSYTDASGVEYQEESFVGRIAGAHSIVSFVRLTVDATSSRKGAVVRFVTSTPSRLVVAKRGPVRVAAGEQTVIYAGWVHAPPLLHPIVIDERSYDRARAGVVAYWERRLDEGAQIAVPDPHAQDAERALLIDQLVQGWHYSLGNPYEQLSFVEALDTAQVMGEYGYPADAQAIMRAALARLPGQFTGWRAGAVLLANAVYYDLYRDRSWVSSQTPALARALQSLAGRQISTGKLQPERLSSDVPGVVDGLPAQAVAWEGLLAMGRVWSVTGHRELAAKAGAMALRLESALRKGLRADEVRMHDGSLFVPDTLTGPSKPYPQVTATRDGSYWNLVMPYAFASGLFPPGGSAAKGILRYLLEHGSRLLGVTRADAHIAYGRRPGSGLAEVYGLSVSRFLADNDQPDQLALSLYGMLAVGMAPDTFVSGEAITVEPLGTAYYRTMYMPPNLGANSTYLETLRLMLVHERRGPHGAPHGLDLAFSTPRTWLEDGDTISVAQARTSFGPVSFSIARSGLEVDASVTAPPAAGPVRMRLRLPADVRLVRIRVGERKVPFNPSTSTFVVPRRHGAVSLVATLATRR
jgi:hypothetical protein